MSAGLSVLGPGAASASGLIESEVREQVRRPGMDRAAEFGPQAYLDDPVVEEVWINERLTGLLSRCMACP